MFTLVIYINALPINLNVQQDTPLGAFYYFCMIVKGGTQQCTHIIIYYYVYIKFIQYYVYKIFKLKINPIIIVWWLHIIIMLTTTTTVTD